MSDWDTRHLGDVATVRYGKSVAGGLSEDGDVTVVGTGESDRRGSRWLVDGDTVVVARKGSLGKPRLIRGKCWPIDTTFYLTDLIGVTPEWLYLVLTTVDLEALNEATGVPSISRERLGQVEIPVPPPRVQDWIVEAIRTADAEIERAETGTAKRRRVRTGLLHDLLARGLDADGRLRAEATHAFRDTPLGRLPTDWSVGEVRRFGTVKLGRQRAPQYESGEGGTPYLRVANVLGGWIDYSDVLRMRFSDKERQTFGLRSGDILLNEGQSLELVGRSAIYRGAPGAYCFQNTLVRFRLVLDHEPVFFQAVFEQWLVRGRFQDVASQTTSIAHLGSDRFAQMLIAVPPPDEQRRIVAVLDAADAEIAREAAALAKLRRVKAGLLRDLLTGRVPVTRLLASAPSA